jgi:type I restriction enzyme, S subunit
LKTIEKAATKSRAKVKHADSPAANSVRPELVEGNFWRIGTVGETGDYINGLAFKPTDWGLVGKPIIRIQNLNDADKPLNRTLREVPPQYLIEAGDILVSWSATLDVFVWDREPSLLNQHIFKVVPNTQVVEKRFLLHLLKWTIEQMKKSEHLHGSTMKHINKGPFLAFPVPIPPIPTQHRIVAEIEEKLSRLDAAQSALLRAQANLKRYRASVLQMACDQALLSAPLESFGKHVVHIESGKSFKCEERPPKDHEIGVAKVSAVTWGEYDEQQTKTCKDESRIEERYLIKSGDFLFTRANTIELIGACVIAKHVALHIMLSDKILRFHFAGSLDKRWALLWLKSHFGRREIERLSTGNQESMRNIGQERIRQIQIAVPSLETQSEIINDVERRLSVIDRTEQTLRTQLERAKRLRQSILQQAFSPS